MARGCAISTLYVLAGMVGSAVGAKVLNTAGLRSSQNGADASDSASKIVREHSEVPERAVIICNAYPHSKPLDILNVRTQQLLTEGEGLAYKSCQDFRISLHEGDRLDFRRSNNSVGIFRASGIPRTTGPLLLVPHRRDGGSSGASFVSHAFAEADGPQVAVVDTCKGKAGKVTIMDAESDKEGRNLRRAEELRFSSVVALSPGKYVVSLQGDDKKDASRLPLEVANVPDNFNVVLRTGLPNAPNATVAAAFPEELVVYSERRARSSAAGLRLPLLVGALAALAASAA